MSGFTIRSEGLGPLRSRFKRTVAKTQERVRKVNNDFVPLTRNTLVQFSSGRPGPEVETGAYNSAYDVHTTGDGMGVEASNPSPQSNRLEYGFVGVDALGRMYHQPAYPHFRPAMMVLAPEYVKRVKTAVLLEWY